ncbi:TPA: NTPase [Escherichia coli]|nr:NTPase [Escherichia coli]
MSDVKEQHMAGNDSPITNMEEDRYGFRILAEKLARSIISMDRNISTVIGIEGKWGSGKTSLLNLLLKEMVPLAPAKTHVLKIAPWLSSSGKCTVESLLTPVAAILDEEDAKTLCWLRRKYRQLWKKTSPLANDMLRYAQQASGQIAPLVEFAGNWVPGAGFAASGLKTVSTTNLSARRKTTAELRDEIEKKMTRLGVNFIVVLDDLDRLEPGQAVEVLRLIRSVADFSGFHYVMCYDPVILGHAIEHGLGVTDGRVYLQKIVPISFRIPLPESFDLRREFLAGAVEIYTYVNGAPPDFALYQDLKSVTGRFGATLTTPREVRLALSSLTFRYGNLREHVWFPDLCLLQLLRVTLPDLYLWVERYLTEYAVFASGTGSISDRESEALTSELQKLLSELPPVSALSVFELAEWLPGIVGMKEDDITLFSRQPEQQKTEHDTNRRLRSGFYWRFYFAFTAPRDVRSPDFFSRMFILAGDPDRQRELSELLFGELEETGFSSRTWFEHVIDKLTMEMLSQATPAQCLGLLRFIFINGTKISRYYRQRDGIMGLESAGLTELADRLFQLTLNATHRGGIDCFSHALQDRQTFNWAMTYLRHLLWQNGLAGTRPVPQNERVLGNDDLRHLCQQAAAWLENPDNQEAILANGELSDLVYAWREISTTESVATWLTSVTDKDDVFLEVLLRLRYDGIRTNIGRYQGLKLNTLAEFFGGEEYILKRLDNIEAKGHLTELTSQVRKAIELDSPDIPR